MELSKKEQFILIILCLLVFIIVYMPHLTYPYPIHIDEWNHIENALRLKQNFIISGISGSEIGFQVFLIILSFFTNIVLIYKFLPALWAVFSALVLFYIIKQKTQNIPESFLISAIAIIFFASIKSNINILGLWFFTPLTFSIPFIFLYIFLFTESIEKENKKMLFLSLLIMSMLIFIHSISLLFSIPFLIIYCLINFKKTKKQFKTLIFFLVIPILGILFYKFLMQIPFKSVIMHLFNSLQFKKGWGVSEMNNSPFELYSLIGYTLILLGIFYIFYSKQIKKYLIFILWPISLIISIIIFKTTGVSYLSPYQRNLYYFAISLPILSSFGFYFIFSLIKDIINDLNPNINKKILNYLIPLLLISLIIVFSFTSYFELSRNIKPYRTIDKEEYNTLKFLSNLPNSNDSKIIAPVLISSALFPVSRLEPVATVYFKGNQTELSNFFKTKNCSKQEILIKKYNVSYILSSIIIDCNWTLIYNKTENNKTNYIYRYKDKL